MKWEPNAWLAKLPSTNFVIFVAMNLALMVTLRSVLSGVELVLVVSRVVVKFTPWDPPADLLAFIFGCITGGVAQFGIKRKTHKPQPPEGPDIEDAPALDQQKEDKAERDGTPPPADPATEDEPLVG